VLCYFLGARSTGEKLKVHLSLRVREGRRRGDGEVLIHGVSVLCDICSWSSPPAANYTREAGVRNLERTIGSICRAIAVKIAEGQDNSTDNRTIIVTPEMLEDILGPRKFEHEISERLTRPGVAVGKSVAPIA